MVPPVCHARIVIQRRLEQHLSPELATPSSQFKAAARRIAEIQSKINHSRSQRRHHRAGRQGQKSMIKLVYCITKRPDLSDQEFFRYWKTIHGPIGSSIPRLRKLVQSHRINIPGDKYLPAYDGIAELWFDTIEDLLAARQSPEWRFSTADESNFIDHTRVAYFVTQEHAIDGRLLNLARRTFESTVNMRGFLPRQA
jgi:uncharacterized protein (TIGR02118 family)